MKIPTDLLGKDHVEYAVGPRKPKSLALREARARLVEIIKQEGALSSRTAPMITDKFDD